MTNTIHTCPACQLRFVTVAEMISHVRDDHQPADPSVTPEAPWGTVTVPIDPLGDNSAVLDVATALASQADMALSIVGVPAAGASILGTQGALKQAAASAREAGISATTWHLIDEDDIAGALVDVVRDGDTTLLVMATHARGPVGEIVLGSISSHVVRQSPVPIVLVGPNVKPQEDPFSHLLVALDGSPESEDALQAAAALAPRLNARVVLAEVLDPKLQLPDDVSEAAVVRRAAASLPASRTDWEVLHDTDPARAISGAAVSLPHAMIVMGTHGRSGLRRMAAGSVTREVVRHSLLPVMVVGPAPE